MEDEQIKLKVDEKLEQREAEQDPIEWKLPEPNPTEPNHSESKPTEPNPTKPNPTEPNPTEPNLTEPKPEFLEELKPNFPKNVKWFFDNTPISAILVFYVLITVGAILCDQHSQYRNYIRPWVVNYNAIFLIALFWSMVEKAKRYPICICFLVNSFLLICDIYCLGSIASSNSYDYGYDYHYNYDRNYNDTNSSYWLLFVSFVSRPIVCYVLFGKFMNQIDEAKKVDECLNKSEYHACNTKSNLKQLEWSVDKLKKSFLTKIPVHYIFGFYFFISILIICIDSLPNFDENKWLVVVSDVLLLISFAFFLAIEQVKSKSLMLMSVIGFNLLAAWTDFNLICYLHFDVRHNFTVYIYVSFWLLVFSLFTRPYTTFILHRHLLSYPKLEIESEIAKLWTNFAKLKEDVEANEKTNHTKPWDQFQNKTENDDTIATKKAKCFKCSFSIEF